MTGLPDIKKKVRPASAQTRDKKSGPGGLQRLRPQSAHGGGQANDLKQEALDLIPPPMEWRGGGILKNSGIYAESQKGPAMTEEGRLRYLAEQLYETKKEGHTVKKKQVKLTAKSKCLERSIAKRDRHLKSIAESNRGGLPLSVSLLESLRQQNHNQLPLYKKKRAELEESLQERDMKIANLKKEPLFTKIVELEAILTCYQNEHQRLMQLHRDSGASGDVSSQEIAVMQRMLRAKNEEITTLLKKKERQVEEVAEVEAEYELFMEDYKRVEDSLQQKHLEVKSVYERFKSLLEEVKKKELLKTELEKLEQANQDCDRQIAKVETQLREHLRVNNRVDIGIFRKSHWLPPSVKDLLYRLRRRCQARAREWNWGLQQDQNKNHKKQQWEDPTNEQEQEDLRSLSLIRLFQKADTDGDGLVSPSEILWVFETVGVAVRPQDVTDLCRSIYPDDPSQSPRYLDLVILSSLERHRADEEALLLNSISDIDVEDLRISFNKKSMVSYAKFKETLLRAQTFGEVKDFFEKAMGAKDRERRWARIWELFGAGIILTRVHSWI